MTRLFSYFTIQTPWTLVYMLQQVEYKPLKLLKWFLAFPNLLKLQKRGRLDLTARAKLMLAVAYASWVLGFMVISFLALWLLEPWLFVGLLFLPMLSLGTVSLTTALLQSAVVNPSESRQIRQAKQKLNSHKAIRIAVLGSYGKTTMKELLRVVLSESKKVAATPGNKNVLVSHARWVNKHIKGDEDVIIFEYGEAAPGDISTLAGFSQPHIAVVTGLAPAHLDAYKTLESVADDLATIQKFVDSEKTYIHADKLLKQKISGLLYDETGLGELKASDVQVDFSGTSFRLRNKEHTLKLHTGLLGSHQVGPLSAVVDVALKLGLTPAQVTKGVAATKPFEHRMQARHLHGAWIIDDTYNGNIEGMRAGLKLLKNLPGKRKIYVTPGLVDQGIDSPKIHEELGQLISAANPDKVVLMKNSVTEHIQSGLSSAGYSGDLQTEENPLEYYTNLEHFLAAGDVVMLQNDWPDSYQ